MAPRNPQFSLYLPRTLLSWQAAEPDGRRRTEHGTIMFVDISGFTPLVERATAGGRAGAEEISAIINQAFEEFLAVAMDEGGDVLKFGGDASLLFFSGEGHLVRAARAALDIHDAIADAPALQADDLNIGVSIGLECGEFNMVVGGTAHRELLVFGPAIDRALAAEQQAETGQVVAGPRALEQLPPNCVDGDFVVDAPDDDAMPPMVTPPSGDALDLADYVPVRLRDHQSVAGLEGEHRHTAIGFVHIPIPPGPPDERDKLLASFTDLIGEQAERHEVALLASDAEIGGIKFMLCAGAPSASTDEEERLLRAVRRVLDMAEGVTPRAGVTRGVVFCGDFGAVSRRYYTLLGDSANLAARLMGAAEPGVILTFDQVLDRSPTRFAIERFEPLMLKGKSKAVLPVSVGAVTGIERVDWARFLPLIGRAEELSVLLRALADVRRGDGGVVRISGEPGVGKTRLVSELIDRATALDTYELLCEHYELSTPHFISGHLLRALLGLKPDLAPDETLERLVELGRAFPHTAPLLPLLAAPLGVTLEATPETAAIASEFRAARMHQLVEELITELRPDPMLVVVEDSHWIDSASRSLIDFMCDATDRQPWLIIETFRSADPSTAAEPVEGQRSILLQPLADDALHQLIRIAARENPASDQAIDAILARADGHPFFALELLRHVGSEGLPESVEAVVAQRIDQLDGRDRQLLRYVAVLGNSFPLDLLAEALPQVAPSAEDNDTWQRLSGFIDVTVFGTVQFKQDLIRLVAYEGLTFRRRREIHGIVAEAIERRARRRARRQAPLLARHNALAGRWDKAWEFATIAGDQAVAAGASADAVRLYGLALDAAAEIGDLDNAAVAVVHESLSDAALLAGELDAVVAALDNAIRLVGEERSEDRARHCRKMARARRDMGELGAADEWVERGLSIVGTEPSAERIQLLGIRAGLLHRGGEHQASNEAAAVLMAEARAIGADAGYGLGASLTMTNDAALGRPHSAELADEAIAIFDRLGDVWNRAKVRNNVGLSLYFSGEWDAAAEAWAAARVDYRGAGDVIGSATAENNVAEILSDRGHFDQAEERFLDALRAWRAAGFSIGVALATQNQGRVKARRGDTAQAEALLVEALGRFEAIGSHDYVLDTRLRLAEMHAFAGSLESLRAALDALPDLSGEATLLPGWQRLEAIVAAADGDHPRIESALADAMAAAEGTPFERALTLRLQGRLLDDPEATAEAQTILNRLGAADAADYAPMA